MGIFVVFFFQKCKHDGFFVFKVYQDAWRTEREQYKKALEEYNASLNETELVGFM